MRIGAIAPLALLVGCAPATWSLETWGEAFIEEGLPAEEFVDGCSATFDHFLVTVANPGLVGGSGEAVSDLPAETVWDLVGAGPHAIGASEVPATTYSRVDVTVGPASAAAAAGNATADQVAQLVDGGWSIHVAGELTCGARSAAFAWGFDTETTYRCEPELTLAAGGQGSTEFTVHGDHLFYDALEDPEAGLRGEALLDADDGDGDLTQAELAAVALAPLGDYDVGGFSEVTDLAAFVEHQTTSVGHVDGEGHCALAP
jgi:hypothetical protein